MAASSFLQVFHNQCVKFRVSWTSLESFITCTEPHIALQHLKQEITIHRQLVTGSDQPDCLIPPTAVVCSFGIWPARAGSFKICYLTERWPCGCPTVLSWVDCCLVLPPSVLPFAGSLYCEPLERRASETKGKYMWTGAAQTQASHRHSYLPANRGSSNLKGFCACGRERTAPSVRPMSFEDAPADITVRSQAS